MARTGTKPNQSWNLIFLNLLLINITRAVLGIAEKVTPKATRSPMFSSGLRFMMVTAIKVVNSWRTRYVLRISVLKMKIVLSWIWVVGVVPVWPTLGQTFGSVLCISITIGGDTNYWVLYEETPDQNRYFSV